MEPTRIALSMDILLILVDHSRVIVSLLLVILLISVLSHRFVILPLLVDVAGIAILLMALLH